MRRGQPGQPQSPERAAGCTDGRWHGRSSSRVCCVPLEVFVGRHRRQAGAPAAVTAPAAGGGAPRVAPGWTVPGDPSGIERSWDRTWGWGGGAGKGRWICPPQRILDRDLDPGTLATWHAAIGLSLARYVPVVRGA